MKKNWGQGKNREEGALFEKFQRCVKEFSLMQKGDSVVIGVSGGPDSTALCYLLKEIQEKLSLRVALAYLNHGLRKEESLNEEKFVKALGHRLGFPVIVERADVNAYRKKTPALSLQEAARKLRFAFFARAAGKARANKIALAHHADDQVETMILRMLEGAGLEGLSGIHPVREMKGMTIIRPLLFAAKKDILKYLKENKIPYCVDSSNEKLVYKRNAVRKKLLPALEKINPNARENLFRVWDIFYHENEYMWKRAKESEKKVTRHGRDSVVLSFKRFGSLPLPIQRRVLKNVLAAVRGSSEDVAFRHVESVRKWMAGHGEKLILPGGLRVTKEKTCLRVQKERGKSPTRKPRRLDAASKTLKIKIPGTKKLWNGFHVRSEILRARDVTETMLTTKNMEAYLDFSKAGGNIFARHRKSGDRFIPYGMQNEIKLKEYYIKAKVKREQRDSLPVFENSQHIVWIPAGRVDARAKVDNRTRNVLHLWMERI